MRRQPGAGCTGALTQNKFSPVFSQIQSIQEVPPKFQTCFKNHKLKIFPEVQVGISPGIPETPASLPRAEKMQESRTLRGRAALIRPLYLRG